jgi:hypothetical protein
MKNTAKTKRNLLLSTEKVRELQRSDLRRVAGGSVGERTSQVPDSDTPYTSCNSSAPGIRAPVR